MNNDIQNIWEAYLPPKHGSGLTPRQHPVYMNLREFGWEYDRTEEGGLYT